jgi:putative two-component system response regulator
MEPDVLEREGRPTVLVVEDDDVGRELLQRILEDEGGYATAAAANAFEARRHLAERSFAAALIDYRMPGESGIDLLKYVRAEHPDTATIMVTALDDRSAVEAAFEIGAFGYVVKPYRINELLINLSNALHRRSLEIQTRSYIRELEDKVLDRTKLLREALVEAGGSRLAPVAAEEVIERLSGALTFRDEETGAHIRRMSHYSALLAERGGMDIPAEEIRLASAMHDIGKIGIPDAILQKPGPLTPDERAAMERHTLIGHELLSESGSPLLRLGAAIALGHHEKWNGTGYPSGLAGEDIPPVGRVTAVADVFDALTSDRVYRPALAVDQAVEIMRRGRGVHFDPHFLDLFLDCLDMVLDLRRLHPDPPRAVRMQVPGASGN